MGHLPRWTQIGRSRSARRISEISNRSSQERIRTIVQGKASLPDRRKCRIRRAAQRRADLHQVEVRACRDLGAAPLIEEAVAARPSNGFSLCTAAGAGWRGVPLCELTSLMPDDQDIRRSLARAFDRAWEGYYRSGRVTISHDVARTELARKLCSFRTMASGTKRVFSQPG
jgi:hypothetical protein